MTSLTLPSSPYLDLQVRLIRRRAMQVARTVQARQPSAPQLVLLLALVLAVGIGVSILTTSNPIWWHLHFSELGIYHDFSGDVFNATLVAAGAVIVVFALRVRFDLVALSARGRRRPRFLVGLMLLGGVQLAIVGLVPVDTLTFLHDRAASGVMFCFGALLLCVGRGWRALPSALRLTTALVSLALAGATPVFILGIINLAAFELVGFTLIFVWLGVFTTALHRDATDIAAPRASLIPMQEPAVSRSELATAA